ncbi:alpha/beta fold hydrolase [candidate division KSB1 bacterium]|nr:alpha/beta fold hydrolase [candidate division KSB1 bacterium]
MFSRKNFIRNKFKFLLGCFGVIIGFVVLIVALTILWFNSNQPNLDSKFHPFKSTEAKESFLAYYDKKAKQYPVPSENRIVQTIYGPTFLRISGQENAPVLILLHGAGGNSLQWLPNIEALSEHFRTYAIDNIYDCGRSKFTRPISTANDFRQWLDDLFEKLNLKNNINIVGLSYGGWIATEYALKHPDSINKLVLIAPAGTIVPLSSEWILRSLMCLLPHKYFTGSYIRWLAEDSYRMNESGKKFVETHIEEAYLALKSYKLKTMVNPRIISDAELKKMDFPVLFLIGENEKICSPMDAINRLNRVAPEIKTKLVSDAGHDLTYARASLVNNLIIDFINGTD